MPTANAINQANISVAQLKACPHPYISAPHAPGGVPPEVWHIAPIAAPDR